MTGTLPRSPSFRLEGRRGLVAGAMPGIGQRCAGALAEAGATRHSSPPRANYRDVAIAAARQMFADPGAQPERRVGQGSVIERGSERRPERAG
jgi:NAD(P)-dependent dehydrogenase (short-subunit alcohol dehydrogenase family)